MPGMLRKSTAFVPRYQKFESISLQRRVFCELGSRLSGVPRTEIGRNPASSSGESRENAGLVRDRTRMVGAKFGGASAGGLLSGGLGELLDRFKQSGHGETARRPSSNGRLARMC